MGFHGNKIGLPGVNTLAAMIMAYISIYSYSDLKIYNYSEFIKSNIILCKSNQL